MRRIGGQVSFEFLMLVGIGLLSVTLFGGVIAERMVESQEEQEYLRLQGLADDLRTELVLAAEVADGYERSFVLPQTANYQSYTVTIVGNGLIVDDGEREVFRIIPLVQGNFTQGNNTVRKQSGQVILNGA